MRPRHNAETPDPNSGQNPYLIFILPVELASSTAAQFGPYQPPDGPHNERPSVVLPGGPWEALDEPPRTLGAINKHNHMTDSFQRGFEARRSSEYYMDVLFPSTNTLCLKETSVSSQRLS